MGIKAEGLVNFIFGFSLKINLSFSQVVNAVVSKEMRLTDWMLGLDSW